jgi:hypothetical protein
MHGNRKGFFHLMKIKNGPTDWLIKIVKMNLCILIITIFGI